MARTKTTARRAVLIQQKNVWPKSWKYPKCYYEDIDHQTKRGIFLTSEAINYDRKYFNKRIQYLDISLLTNHIPSLITNSDTSTISTSTLKTVISRKKFLRHLNIYLSPANSLQILPSLTKLKSLSLQAQQFLYFHEYSGIRNLLKRSKHLEILRMKNNLSYASKESFPMLRFLRNLKSIYFKPFAQPNSEIFRKVFVRNLTKLENIILNECSFNFEDEELGDFSPKKKEDTPKSFTSMLNKFQSLKVFKMDYYRKANYSLDDLCIEQFPRHLKYDIRVNQNESIQFSENFLESVQDIEYLGINTRKFYSHESKGPSWLKNEIIKAQKNCRRIFLLNLFALEEIPSLDPLIMACNQLLVLHINLSEASLASTEFFHLSRCENLEKLFLQFHKFTGTVTNSLKNLAAGLSSLQKLNQVIIEFDSNKIEGNDWITFSYFMQALRSISELFVRFKSNIANSNGLTQIYEGLKIPQNLSKFLIMVTQDNIEKDIQNIETVLPLMSRLKELSICLEDSAFIGNVKLPIKGLKLLNILNLQVRVKSAGGFLLSFSEELRFLEQLQILCLNFYFETSLEMIKDFIKELKHNKSLEYTYLRSNILKEPSDQISDEIRHEIQGLMNNLNSLRKFEFEHINSGISLTVVC